MGYSRPSAPSIFPLDQALALPARSFSYELQRRLVKAAVQNPFLESVQTIAELTGVPVSKRSLEEILPHAARDFDAFYQQPSVATAAGSILVAAVDGKGIGDGLGDKHKLRTFDRLPTDRPNALAIATMAMKYVGRDESILLVSEGLGPQKWRSNRNPGE